jgi:hypothetical protein
MGVQLGKNDLKILRNTVVDTKQKKSEKEKSCLKSKEPN